MACPKGQLPPSTLCYRHRVIPPPFAIHPCDQVTVYSGGNSLRKESDTGLRSRKRGSLIGGPGGGGSAAEEPPFRRVATPIEGSDSAAPWAVAYQAPLSSGWSRLPFPSPGELPDPGWKWGLPHCRRRLTAEPPGGMRAEQEVAAVCWPLLGLMRKEQKVQTDASHK